MVIHRVGLTLLLMNGHHMMSLSYNIEYTRLHNKCILQNVMLWFSQHMSPLHSFGIIVTLSVTVSRYPRYSSHLPRYAQIKLLTIEKKVG